MLSSAKSEKQVINPVGAAFCTFIHRDCRIPDKPLITSETLMYGGLQVVRGNSIVTVEVLERM